MIFLTVTTCIFMVWELWKLFIAEQVLTVTASEKERYKEYKERTEAGEDLEAFEPNDFVMSVGFMELLYIIWTILLLFTSFSNLGLIIMLVSVIQYVCLKILKQLPLYYSVLYRKLDSFVTAGIMFAFLVSKWSY